MARTRVLAPILVVAAVLALGVLYVSLSYRSAINSDSANTALQGLAMWRGNPLLRGWWLAQDTFYFTDAALYGALATLQGIDPVVVHEAIGFIYAAAVVVVALVARGPLTGRTGWAAAVIAGAVMVLPPTLLLQGLMHILGCVYALVAILLVEWRPGARWTYVVALLLLAAAMASDPFVLLVFAPAIVLAGLRRRSPGLLLLAAAAVAIGQAAPRAITALGGFQQPVPLALGLAPARLGANANLFWRGILLVFDADFRDQPGPTWVLLVHLSGVVGAAAGFVLALARWRGTAPGDLVPQVLSAVIVVDVAAFLLTGQPSDLASSRFLVPSLLAGAALAGRMLAPLLLRRPAPRVAAAVVVAALLATVPVPLLRPPAPTPTAELEAWLGQHGLTYGLGSYWASSIVTLDTHGRVSIRTVDALPGGRVGPDRWFADSSWYAPRPGRAARFVVFQFDRPHRIDEASAIAAFGPPLEIAHVGAYEVLVYPRDLLPDLAR